MELLPAMVMMSEFREPLVDRWLSWLKAGGASANTITTYKGQLRQLQEWAEGPVLYLTHEQLSAWQVAKSEHVTGVTVRCAMTAHRSFYRWACDEGLIDVDPTRRLRMPRAPRRLPRPMEEDDVATALRSAAPQEAAIIALAGFAGLRACEIAGLDWSEVSLASAEPILRTIGKGGHERVVDVSPDLAGYLTALPRPHRGPVIARRDGKAGHCGPWRISQMANRFLDGLGIDATLHQLRHRFATAMYDVSGGDLRAVQEACGHASPTTTAIYAKVSRRNIRAAVVAAGRINTGGTAA